MSVTFAPPLTENTVTVTPASPERSLTTQVEGSGTSASSAEVWLQSGTAPPVALATMFCAAQTMCGAADGSATTSAPARTTRPTMIPSQLMLAWPRSEARRARVWCGVSIGASAQAVIGADVRRARTSRRAPSAQTAGWTGRRAPLDRRGPA